jgi:erythromycin esterase-like protein
MIRPVEYYFRDLDPLIQAVKDKRVVMLGESSHGTHEFYLVRRIISQRLIEDYGFNFIAVEGDWPDGQRMNHYIQSGHSDQARHVLMLNHRWPTWMWANTEVEKLLEWMHLNRKASFHGLDVYSLFESIDEVLRICSKAGESFCEEVRQRYSCFEPFERDEMNYAKSLLRFPAGCQSEVLENLQQLLRYRHTDFSAIQNARIVVNAERYYRAMLFGEQRSWNIRDEHMMDTLNRLLESAGEGAKAIVWAHNTHIGDYKATDMKDAGYVNLGGLARERYGKDNVALVGFGTYQGTVLAARAWGAPEEVMTLPEAIKGSLEERLHKLCFAKNTSRLLLLLEGEPGFEASVRHRAVGVVYDPEHERRSQYVPTELTKRYDAFIFIDRTNALRSYKNASIRGELPETWPSGF